MYIVQSVEEARNWVSKLHFLGACPALPKLLQSWQPAVSHTLWCASSPKYLIILGVQVGDLFLSFWGAKVALVWWVWNWVHFLGPVTRSAN